MRSFLPGTPDSASGAEIASDAFVLLYAAEFSQRKSQATLLRAMPLLPERVVLALPGQGALLDECRRLAEALGLGDRVLFPGYCADMAPWYVLADCAVSASRSEGLPFNIMEAMHASLPVVATAVKGHTDLVTPGQTGFCSPMATKPPLPGPLNSSWPIRAVPPPWAAPVPRLLPPMNLAGTARSWSSIFPLRVKKGPAPNGAGPFFTAVPRPLLSPIQADSPPELPAFPHAGNRLHRRPTP